jgi:hypothetical protein
MSAAGQVGGELTNEQFVKLLCSGKPVHLRDCIIKGQVDLSYGRFTKKQETKLPTNALPFATAEGTIRRLRRFLELGPALGALEPKARVARPR